MKKIVAIIYDFKEYVVLFITITLSITMIMTNTNPQVRALRGEILDILRYIQKPLNQISSLEDVRVENKRLRRRNVELAVANSQLNVMGLQNRRLRDMLNFKENSVFKYVPAEVIGRRKDTYTSSIILDAGREDGIKQNMPIVNTGGVVGKVIEVGARTSVGQLLDDSNFRLSVKILPEGANGILVGKPGMSDLREIPKNLSVMEGDIVITSGYSDIFPMGLTVGSVTQVKENPGSFFKNLKMKPSAELDRLEEVFIIIEIPVEESESELTPE